MKSGKWLLCGLLAVSFAMGQAVAADPTTTKAPKEGDKPKKENLGFYGIMASVVKMTDDQKAKVEEKVTAEKAALEQWKKDNGSKVDDAKKALAAAQEAKDKDAVAKARAQLKALDDNENKIRANAAKDIMALLTDEQKLTWFTYTLVDGPNGAKNHFKAAEMTDDQIKQAKDLAKDPAKLLASGKDADGKDLDQKSTHDIHQKFFDAVKDKVLTADQKKKLEEAKTASRPAGDKPAVTPKATAAPK